MTSQKDYNQNIIILRGLSVLLVLLYHLDISLFRNGFLGVDIFFIISGYLISRSLILEKKHNGYINIKNYLFKRFFRIFPTLVLVLTFSFIRLLKLSVLIPVVVKNIKIATTIVIIEIIIIEINLRI